MIARAIKPTVSARTTAAPFPAAAEVSFGDLITNNSPLPLGEGLGGRVRAAHSRCLGGPIQYRSAPCCSSTGALAARAVRENASFEHPAHWLRHVGCHRAG